MGIQSLYNLVDDKKRKEVLNFPVTVPCNQRILNVLSSKLKGYVEIVKKNKSKLVFNSKQVKLITTTVDNIKNVVEQINEACFDSAYDSFVKMMDLIKEEIFDDKNSVNDIFVNNSEISVFYRSRAGHHKEISDFYHVPITKNYLCRDYRFSEAGYPMLYLSHTKECSLVEFGNQETTTSKFTLKENNNLPKLKILDLAHPFFNMSDASSITDKTNFKFHLLWPLIASCYCISFWCEFENAQCNQINRSYKQEYTFPQFLSRYLRSNYPKIDGIRYFTVRNESLDSKELDMTNYALFTKNYNEKGEDRDLLDRFEIKII